MFLHDIDHDEFDIAHKDTLLSPQHWEDVYKRQLLQVEVEVTSTGVKKQIILQSGQNAMSDEEAAARMAELAALKLSPRDQEENKLAMMRAERMYEESTGAVRRKVDGLIAAFDTALASQDPLEAERGRKALLEALDQLEEGAQ